MALPLSRAGRAAPSEEQASCDVLVIGAGPAGSSAAYHLARAGHEVLVVEKKHLPRSKTCGDGLTPRALRQLYDMGLKDELANAHRFVGLRALGFGRELELAWPEVPGYPDHGSVLTRFDLDDLVARRAEKAGARVFEGVEAVEPLGNEAGRGGPMLGAVCRVVEQEKPLSIAARYVVVADGANSRIGRALGTTRDRSVPLGMALRGYYSSPRHKDSYIESHLDLRDRSGNVLPGYGWIFPLGDGRVNVGVGLLGTPDRLKGVNTSTLYEAFVASAPASWGLEPATSLGAPTGGRLPMGLSVGPRSGPDFLLAGDAGGSINPFNGEGIAYGYETGRLAAEVVDDALSGSGAAALRGYEPILSSTYGRYFAVGSAFMRLLGRPEICRTLLQASMRQPRLMAWVLRIMSNALRQDTVRAPELMYRAAAALVGRAPARAALRSDVH